MRPLLLTCLLVGLGLSLAACDSTDNAATARLTVRLTDAPFPFDLAEAAEVTITRIELLAAEPDSSASDSTGADSTAARDRIVLYDGAPFQLNLLDLRDGVDTLLVERFVIPADGSYDQIRLYVGEDAQVRFFDGQVFPLKLPSADRQGIKVFLPEYDATGIAGDIELLIDFDVERSFVSRGNPESDNFQGFLFKPILAVETFSVDGVPADTTGTKE